MRLTHEVRIAQPPDAVFDALTQVERSGGCLPGGRLTGEPGQADADRYAGEVAVDVGPLHAAYTGTVRYLEVDREARRAALRVSGTERAGLGDADAHIVARVLPDDGVPPARSVVSVDVDLLVRGRVAQLGLGVVGEVGRRLIDEFASNLDRLLAEEPVGQQPIAEPAPGGTATGTPQPARAARAARAAAPRMRAAISVAGGVALAGVALAWWWRHHPRR